MVEQLRFVRDKKQEQAGGLLCFIDRETELKLNFLRGTGIADDPLIGVPGDPEKTIEFVSNMAVDRGRWSPDYCIYFTTQVGKMVLKATADGGVVQADFNEG